MSLKFRTSAEADSILNQLIQLSDIQQRRKSSYKNTLDSLISQIGIVSNAEQLRNLTPSVNKFSNEMKRKGHDEYDSASLFLNVKKSIYEPAERSFDYGLKIAKSLEFDPNVDPDGTGPVEAKKVIVSNASFEEASQQIGTLSAHLSNIDNAIVNAKYIHTPKKGNERFNSYVIREAISKELGVYRNKMKLFEKNSEMFTIDENEDGVPDIESLEFYEELMQRVLSGDSEGFGEWFDGKMTNLTRKYDRNMKFYLNLKDIQTQISPEQLKTSGKTRIDFDKIKSGDDESRQRAKNLFGAEGAYVELNTQQLRFLVNRLNIVVDNMKKYNKQSTMLIKTPIDSNPLYNYDEYLTPNPDDLPGTVSGFSVDQSIDLKSIIKEGGF